MITPYHEEAKNLPVAMRTRMTLTLLNSTRYEERAAEFRNVPDTFLMFLRNLQRLSIELHPSGEVPEVTQYSKLESQGDGWYMTSLTSTHSSKEEDFRAKIFHHKKQSQ